MADQTQDLCGKCGAEIDATRRIDYTLKDGQGMRFLFRKGHCKSYSPRALHGTQGLDRQRHG